MLRSSRLTLALTDHGIHALPPGEYPQPLLSTAPSVPVTQQGNSQAASLTTPTSKSRLEEQFLAALSANHQEQEELRAKADELQLKLDNAEKKSKEQDLELERYKISLTAAKSKANEVDASKEEVTKLKRSLAEYKEREEVIKKALKRKRT